MYNYVYMHLGLNQSGLISKVVVFRGGRLVGFHCRWFHVIEGNFNDY